MNKRIVPHDPEIEQNRTGNKPHRAGRGIPDLPASRSDRRVFLLSLVNYNPDAAREDVVQKQIAADEERNALPGKILYEQEHTHECFLSDSSFRKIQFLTYIP